MLPSLESWSSSFLVSLVDFNCRVGVTFHFQIPLYQSTSSQLAAKLNFIIKHFEFLKEKKKEGLTAAQRLEMQSGADPRKSRIEREKEV